ncbi:phosphohydrolase [Anaerotalea alkaliphila]|uniref:Phosphohydrolase n=1 Tax=Anaerotalea alkaliphila TaxID=2662126 RepID=A0A7X5HV67_9FIRM|nr:phosphohydrolase [Anaerotalea alkaliphila]NDL67243.1 phosphohydrolase [Anaerotalea alkaliphila]
MADYILTYTKTKFHPLDPVEEDIHIEDIAHSLSLMTRANGHFRHFYSVAQHSINCWREAASRGHSDRVRLGCLLHDASESYLSDITRPVKRNLHAYGPMEERLQKAVYRRFGIGDLTEEELGRIREIDDALLYHEFQELMEVAVMEVMPVHSRELDFSQRDFGSVEKEFLSAFRRTVPENPSVTQQ